MTNGTQNAKENVKIANCLAVNVLTLLTMIHVTKLTKTVTHLT